jgi:hypothetical protein
MGIYLAKPSTDINSEVGGGGNLEFAVGEMQVVNFVSSCFFFRTLIFLCSYRDGGSIWRMLIFLYLL